MCGIAGVSPRRAEPAESLLRRFADLLAQPIATEGGRAHIVVNGEI